MTATATVRRLLALMIASLLAGASAAAQTNPAPETPPAAPSAAPPAPAKQDPNAAANDILGKSAEPSSDCYRGFHTSFDYNITGAALTALGRQVIAPGGLCDQYRKYSADMPIEIGVPVLPGVSVNLDKLCKMVQRPPCPEGEQSESQDQTQK